MKRTPSRRLTIGLGAATLAAGASAVVASMASAPAALASDSLTTTASTSTAAAPLATSDLNARCGLALPANVLGDPHVHAGAANGLRVWHDGTGWHLRATHPGHDAVVYTGVVTSGQPITAHGYDLEAQDQIGFSPDHRTMTFRFVDHGGIDGIDFTDRCADHTTFDFRRDGSQMSRWNIDLGAYGAHPASNPFTERRFKA